MAQTPEHIAAEKLALAEESMRDAATALEEIGSDESTLHAKEMRGAVKMARRWELVLRRMRGNRAPANEARMSATTTVRWSEHETI